jgi:transcriptional regulator with XRE-family HTH domain
MLGWSLRTLAKAAGVHYNTVNNFELGHFAGRPETLAAIKKALERGGVIFTNGRWPGVKLKAR